MLLQDITTLIRMLFALHSFRIPNFFYAYVLCTHLTVEIDVNKMWCCRKRSEIENNAICVPLTIAHMISRDVASVKQLSLINSIRTPLSFAESQRKAPSKSDQITTVFHLVCV